MTGDTFAPGPLHAHVMWRTEFAITRNTEKGAELGQPLSMRISSNNQYKSGIFPVDVICVHVSRCSFVFPCLPPVLFFFELSCSFRFWGGSCLLFLLSCLFGLVHSSFHVVLPLALFSVSHLFIDHRPRVHMWKQLGKLLWRRGRHVIQGSMVIPGHVGRIQCKSQKKTFVDWSRYGALWSDFYWFALDGIMQNRQESVAHVRGCWALDKSAVFFSPVLLTCHKTDQTYEENSSQHNHARCEGQRASCKQC